MRHARPVDTQCHDPVEGSQTFRPPALRPMPPTNSPWRGQWNTPEQFFSTVPNSNKDIHKLQELWGQIPAFTGPPQDQWIDELDQAYQLQPEGVHRRYSYGSSAFERSLPKFELSKFDGSPMAWPDWISRFKSVVHNQPFLNDNQRMAYLQTLVTSAAKTEIQYLGEDGMSYTLALRNLKSRFADAGKIVRAAITQLKNTPSPRTNDHHAIVKLYQALRSAVVTLHRQRFIADLISETNLAIVLEKLPDQLAIKWAMEVQKHECYGRPNLFDFDRWLSEQVRCRQHLVHEESVQPITKPKFNARRDNSIRVNTLATSTNHNTTSDGNNGAGPLDTYAILDDGSSDTLIRQDIAEILKLEGPEHQLTLGNVENNGVQRLSRLVNIEVTPTGKGAAPKAVHIERVWTVPRLNVPPRQLVKEKDKQRWKHLQDLDIPAVSTNQVGLLIGVDVMEAMLQHEHRRGSKGQPYAVRTDFGWTVAGADRGTLNSTSDQVHVGYANVMHDQLNEQLEQWWKTESFGTKYDRQELRSIEDERALQNLKANTKFREDLGHYETGLLWKNKTTTLPNNRELAKKRLAQLEQSLDKDPSKAELYYKTMDSYITKGYAKKLTQAEANYQPANT
ncbi:hypothetical protein QZH41_000351 [Actinostola sp. cb2023]|nr:hypothetical protein QZH41_000351 [Actinostola sp. cb2023]